MHTERNVKDTLYCICGFFVLLHENVNLTKWNEMKDTLSEDYVTAEKYT